VALNRPTRCSFWQYKIYANILGAAGFAGEGIFVIFAAYDYDMLYLFYYIPALSDLGYG